MKNTNPDLLAYYADPGVTRTVCYEIVCRDGFAVRGTNYSKNLAVPDEGDDDSPPNTETYYHKSCGDMSDIESPAALEVTHADLKINFDAITEADVRAGRYLGASVKVFLVKPTDLSLGRYYQVVGTMGQITIDRQSITAEVRGVMDKLQQAIGRVYTPSCPWKLGDGNCRRSLVDITVTGTLKFVSADGLTFADDARTEVGPTGALGIVSISNTNPAIVTLDDDVPVANGIAMVLSSAGAFSGTYAVRNKSGATFELPLDATDTALFTPYPGGGSATPLGGTAGWFTYGIMRVTRDGAVYEQEIKSYVHDGTVGQWTLHQPFPFTLAVDDAYELEAGDDRTFTTCRVKFGNGPNFGGFPFIPGQDSISRPEVRG